MEQCEEWKKGNEELGGTEERESEQGTMPCEIDLNKSSSEDVTVASWSNDDYKTNAHEWKSQDFNFVFGSTSEVKESADKLTTLSIDETKRGKSASRKPNLLVKSQRPSRSSKSKRGNQ